MKLLVSIVLFCCFVQLNAQPGFTEIPTTTGSIIQSIDTCNGELYILARNRYISRTKDGFNFDTLYHPVRSVWETANGINVIDTNNIYFLEGVYQNIIYSNNLFTTWDTLYDTLYPANFMTLLMFDTLFGVAVTSKDYIAYTYDGCKSWTWFDVGTFYNPGLFFQSAAKYGDSTIVLGANGVFCTSHNRGNNWFLTGQGNYNPFGYHFINKDTMFIAATYAGSNKSGNLYYTYNGGKNNWNIMLQETGVNFYNVTFKANKKDGYVIGNYTSPPVYGLIYETNNYGSTWNKITTNITKAFYTIHFMNDSLAIITGSNGLVLRWEPNKMVGFNELSNELNPARVFPNPAKAMQSITLEMPLANENYAIKVYETSGRLVYKNPGIQNKLLLYLPQGQYIIQLQNKQGTTTQKVLVLE